MLTWRTHGRSLGIRDRSRPKHVRSHLNYRFEPFIRIILAFFIHFSLENLKTIQKNKKIGTCWEKLMNALKKLINLGKHNNYFTTCTLLNQLLHKVRLWTSTCAWYEVFSGSSAIFRYAAHKTWRSLQNLQFAMLQRIQIHAEIEISDNLPDKGLKKFFWIVAIESSALGSGIPRRAHTHAARHPATTLDFSKNHA